MIWHWIIFAALAVLAFLENFSRVGRKTIIRGCNVIIIVVIFLSSIRWEQLISDWDSYYKVYQSIDINKFSDLFFRHVWDFEFLYNLLLRIVKATVDNYLVVQIVVALIAIGLLYKATLYLNEEVEYNGEKYSFGYHYIALALLLAWATECLNLYAVRTSIASSICLYSIRFIEKRDIKRFVVCIAIGFGFHMSAIVFIPAYFIYHMKMDIKQAMKYLFGAVTLSIVGAPILIKIVGHLGGRIAHKAEDYNYALGNAYFDSVFTTSGFITLAKGFANTALVVVVALYLSHRFKKNTALRPRIDGLCNLYLFGAMLQVVFLPYNMLVARVAVFYINQQFYILPLLLQGSRRNIVNRTLIYVVLLAYAALKMYMLLSGHEGYWTFNNIFSD